MEKQLKCATHTASQPEARLPLIEIGSEREDKTVIAENDLESDVYFLDTPSRCSLTTQDEEETICDDDEDVVLNGRRRKVVF